MQAVILAGGFGTRLAHIVKDVPKPLAKISDKPFLDYLIKNLEEKGVDNFLLLTGYKSELIEERYKGSANIVCVKEDAPLGTGGALFNAWGKLEKDFFLINGDTFFDIDYTILNDFAKDKKCIIALRYSDDISRYGIVNIDLNYKITSFREKDKLPENQVDGYINGGIYYFKKSVLEEYKKTFNSSNISLEKDIFPKMSEVYGLPVGGLFIDIGIPKDYEMAQTLIPEWLEKKTNKALFIDKDGTLIKNTVYPTGSDIQMISSTVDLIKKYRKNDYLIIMVTNQAGIAKGKFTFEQMYENFDAIKSYYKNFGLYFDDIIFCPYHKDGCIKEYSKKSLLRKPSPGMILTECEKFKIDLKKSIMIGDNPDIDNLKLSYLKCEILEEEKCK